MKSLLLLLLLSVGLPAVAVEPEVQRCRAIGDPLERVACYDAWVDAQRARPAATPQVPASPAVEVPAAIASGPSLFGLEHQSVPQAPETIDSTIPGAFEGWEAGTVFTLANGQVWQIADDSRAVYFLQDPKVRVRRGVLGAFYLELEGADKAPRVRRLR